MTHEPMLIARLPAEAGPATAPWLPGAPPSIARCAQAADLVVAYGRSREVTREYSKSFYLSSMLLPAEKRTSIHALYGFCRVSDDIVDRQGDDAATRLDAWRAQARRPISEQSDPILLAWSDTRTRHNVPQRYAEELLDGVEMDLLTTRYATWEDLCLYCYRVASTVGLMSMHITGFRGEAEPYAIDMGIALQLTNVLRDVGEDCRHGRIYLPLEDLARFGYTEQALCAGVIDDRFRALIEFEIQRAEAFYESSFEGVGLLAADSRMAVGAASLIYRGILDKIRANRYDVFNRRAHLSMAEKLACLPRIWWEVGKFAK